MRASTRIWQPKLRGRALAPWLLALITLATCSVAASAAASSLPTESITVGGYPVSPKLVATAGAGSSSTQLPAMAPAPDGSDAEWVVVSGGRQDLISLTPSGTQHMVAKQAFRADNGPPVVYASVDADGYDWILDNDQSVPEDSLYAVGGATSASPGLNPVATFDGYGRDMTLGVDGALYISDDAGNVIRCEITSAPSARCTSFPLSADFDGGAYTVGTGGRLAWFTDAAGELGAITSDGAISGPFGNLTAHVGAFSSYPGTIVAASNGLVYAAGGAANGSGVNTEILAFDPSAPSSPRVVTAAVSDVVSMTIGPDGNVWFLDAGANQGAGAVGRLNVTTGAVTEYPLPSGLSLPAVGARIASGPDVPDQDGAGEIFFSATTVLPSGTAGTGQAVVGYVTGIPFPVVAGTLGFQPLLEVSKQRAAVLTLTCSGPTNAECSGKLKLEIPVASSGPLETVAYDLRGGQVLTRNLRLSRIAFRALEKGSGKSLSAKVTVHAKLGTVVGRRLTFVGPRS